jgi:hypothetical protein
MTIDKVEEKVNDIHAMVEAQILDAQSSKIHVWLSPMEPSKRHRSIRDSRLRNSGTWILQRNEFIKWVSDSPESPCLCCYGDPGAGKTFIAYVSRRA